MKNLNLNKYLLFYIWLSFALVACNSAEVVPSKPTQGGSLLAKPAQSNDRFSESDTEKAAAQIRECLVNLDQSSLAKDVDGKILAINAANSSAKSLFSSSEKLIPDQVRALASYKVGVQKCRQLTNQISSQKLEVIKRVSI